jgi:hypothetical protein
MMSLRGAFFATKQSPCKLGDIVPFGDCFAIARNDMVAKVNVLRELQSAGGEELSALLIVCSASCSFGIQIPVFHFPGVIERVIRRVAN